VILPITSLCWTG